VDVGWVDVAVVVGGGDVVGAVVGGADEVGA
jgi:hypothetical protein